jgi:amidohydrolase
MPFNIEQNIQDLTKFRHHLHSIAEVSGKEQATAEFIADFLGETKPATLQTNIGGHGILATYEGQQKGSHILLRCELDALPIPDKIEANYRSEQDNVGHKCGHDGHMAILCGVAKYLAEASLKAGKVMLLFQPSEETGEGAKRIIEDPKFKSLDIDYCFALHNLPGYEKHQIVVREGVFAAASVGFIADFKGKTAHAAHPEEGTSPALAVAQTIQSLSAVPQFYSPLQEAAKVTVVNANLGERAFGTSPGKGTVMATLRTYNEELLEELKKKCLSIAQQTAQTYGLAFNYEWVEPFPVTKNDNQAYELIKKSAEKLNCKVQDKQNPFSWSEDFGHFTKNIPGAMFGLGAGKSHPPLHAETYDFPDEIIPTGISMFTQIIKEVINS